MQCTVSGQAVLAAKCREAVLTGTRPLLRLTDFRGAGWNPLAKIGALRQTRPACFVRRTRRAVSAVQGRKVYGLKVSKPQTLYIKRVETAAG